VFRPGRRKRRPNVGEGGENELKERRWKKAGLHLPLSQNHCKRNFIRAFPNWLGKLQEKKPDGPSRLTRGPCDFGFA